MKTFADAKAATQVVIGNWAATSTANWVTFVNQYKTAVDLAFAAAANPMDIVGKEYYKALWGNGLEAYNMYRRTSAPRNMQPTLQTGSGPWIRAMVYPSVFANLNSSATQKDLNVVNKVFWDGNAEILN